MVKSRRLFLLTLVLMGILLSATVAVAGCGGGTTTTTAATTAAQDTSQVIGNRALKIFSSNQVGGEFGANSITADNLSKKLADPAQKAGLYLLDVRSKAAYDKGHIEGATQVDFAQWAAPENLNKLPKDKTIIVICYTGNTAAQTTAGLRMLGFNANALKGGMTSWSQTDASNTQIADLEAATFPDVTTPAGASTPAPPATPFEKPSDADYTVLAAKANSVMSSMATSGDYANFTITPTKLNEKLSGADKDKLFLLDIRKTEDFNKGHIDGATHIDFAAVAVPDNLNKLPKDKKIVVICYTGNTAAQANMVLDMLGYDAVVMKNGMLGWDGQGKQAVIQAIQSANKPVVTS